MHILQLGPYPPPEGGINRNMLAIREELQNNGHQCSIIATSKSTKILNEADVYHPRSSQELVKLLQKFNYDILHLHVGGEITKRVLGLVAVCAFFGRGRSVLTIHSGGYPTSKEGLAAKRNSIRGAIFRRFEKIITVNSLIAEVFEKYGIAKEKIKVVYPFVHRNPDPAVEIPKQLKDFAENHSPFLLTVCLLEDTYDLFMQFDAFGKVLEKFPEAGLLIVGSGSLENDLKAAIASKNYADKIFLAGDVEHKITLHLINKADILLRTTKFDGDAIAVREALFLETPVIATDNGLRPAGVNLIPIHDAGALVDQIEKIASGERETKTEKPDDKSNVTEILKIYEEVFDKKVKK
ncbi:glycosyltransferase family 4 protein [soil metagenome]